MKGTRSISVFVTTLASSSSVPLITLARPAQSM